jgi:hypothetical protein
MEVQTEFLWDEKNSIEHPMNYENKSEQGTNDTTNDTKISSTQVDWRDITDPKLKNKIYQKIYQEKNKETLKNQSKIYREANKDIIKQRKKAYYEANKEKIKLKNKNYIEKNKEKTKNYFKTYQELNKDRLKKQAEFYNKKNKEKIKNWKEKNKERLKEQRRNHYANNKELSLQKSKLYYQNNKEKIKNQRKKYKQSLIQNNIQYKLSSRLRIRLNRAIKGNYKSGSAVKDLGCTIDELKAYLESKFQPGMSWNNYGLYGWHIDHIKPLISFDLTDREQFLQAVHYTNLQPLWAKDNLSKNDNYDTGLVL